MWWRAQRSGCSTRGLLSEGEFDEVLDAIERMSAGAM
jgi:hypothetical protein